MATVSTLAYIVEECIAPAIGIMSDALVKKTTVLLIGTATMIIG